MPRDLVNLTDTQLEVARKGLDVTVVWYRALGYETWGERAELARVEAEQARRKEAAVA